MSQANLETEFDSTHCGVFMQRSGAGRGPGVAYSRRKLCFVATDRRFLAGVLLELSKRRDCYAVKYSVQAKDGMYLGRCFMLEDDLVGELWRLFKRHPRLMCTIQDDEFTARFRATGKSDSGVT
jgi:hypothetical protein